MYWVLTHSRLLPCSVSDVSWHSSLTLNYVFPSGTTLNTVSSLLFCPTRSLLFPPHLLSLSIFVSACLLSASLLHLSLPQQMHLSCFLYDFLHWLPGLKQARIGCWCHFPKHYDIVQYKEPYAIWQISKASLYLIPLVEDISYNVPQI